MNLIAVDVGFGVTKAVAPDGPRVSFPSAVLTDHTTGELRRAVGAAGPGHRVTVSVNGATRHLLVGEAAAAAGAVRSWDRVAASRHDYAALVLTALGLLARASAPGQPTGLALGLPLTAYLQRHERRALREHVAGLRASVQVDRGPERTLQVGAVRVFPQAVGVFVRAAAADPLTAIGSVGVLDLGYRTSDLLLLEPSPGGPVPDEARSASLKVGIGQAHDAVARWLERHAGVTVPPGVIEAALGGTGLQQVAGQTYDVRAMFAAEVRTLAQRITDEVRRLWADRLEFLSALLVAGGGGAAAFPHLRALHPVARLLPDPFFANALGFLDMAAASAVV